MTRWQKFGWALGYALLTLYGMFMWITLAEMDLYHYFGASSLIYGLGLGAYSDNDIIGMLSFFNFLLILAGLVLVPILTAFRLRLPLYILMMLDVLGRVLLMIDKLLAGDTYLLVHIILGLFVSIGALTATISMFRQPEPAKEASAHANA